MDDGTAATEGEMRAVQDQFDISLEDSDLLTEVELTTNLIIAASEHEGPLQADEIDQILGIVPPPAPQPRAPQV